MTSGRAAGWLSGCLVVACAVVTVVALGVVALAAPPDNPWPQFSTPSAGAAQAIGDYSAGCLAGAAELPLEGRGYQVMRPSRRRNYGHPALIAYLQTLGEHVAKSRLGILLIGDLSQPRGGRAASGHASHQTGLDVDLWYTRPKSAAKARLTLEEREQLSAESIVDDAKARVKPAVRAPVFKLLELAASDARVDRLFVHPLIKRALCDATPEPRAWLRKVRPWYGHADHFHVRLACPATSPECKPQASLPAGDGCEQLAWWFDPAAQAARKEAKQDYQKSVTEGRGWPPACEELLRNSAPASAPARAARP